MAIPLLVWIGIAAATAVGGGTTIKAAVDSNDAKKANTKAREMSEKAARKAEKSRKDCAATLDRLGSMKLSTLQENVEPFINTFEKIRNIRLDDDTPGMDELRKFRIDKASINELRKLSNMAGTLAGAVGGGAAAGALTAIGAYGAATTLATASTGTAIASLSGAAATNATLAWFGGGSLAAGGLGMAGGAAVLGGLVAAPALAVMGCILSAKASKNKDEAYSNLAKARQYKEEMKTLRTLCDGIRDRADMYTSLLHALRAELAPLNDRLARIVQTSGSDFTRYTPDERGTVAASIAVAKAVKAVLDTPILTEDGKLTSQSGKIIAPVKKVISEHAGS